MTKDQAVTSEKPKRGRPWKNTPEVLERALSAAREGLPLRFCAGLAGITYQTLNEYRKADPGFDQRLETALSEGVQTKFRAILKAGYGSDGAPPKWEALAWSLERAHCAEFSRPEIQLHAMNMQFNSTTNNTIVISAEQASGLRKRNARIDQELDELAKSHEAKQKQLNGSPSSSGGATGGAGSVRAAARGSDRVREVESSLVPATDLIKLPGEKQRTPGWWKMLSGSPGERGIALEAAQYAFKTIAADCVGAARASGLVVDWETTPALSDLWNAISETCGEAGWTALVKRGAVKRGNPLAGPGGSAGREQSRKGVREG